MEREHAKVRAVYQAPEPVVPTGFDIHGDMTMFSLQQLGQAYQYFNGLHAYIIGDLSLTDSLVKAVEFQRRVLKDRLILSNNSGKKYTADALVSQDSRYHQLSVDLLTVEARKTALASAAQGLEGKVAVLSREISRRSEERNRV